MDAFQRGARLLIHGLQLIDHLAQKAVGGRQRNINDVVVPALHRAVLRTVAKVLQQVLSGYLYIAFCHQLAVAGIHSLDSGAGMAGGLNFGNHPDMPFGGILQDLNKVFGSVVSAAREVRFRTRPVRGLQVILIGQRVGAAAAHLGKFRQARYLDAPSLVVIKVKMKDVQLVERHEVQRFQDLLFGLKVAGYVLHKSAVPETRVVADLHSRYGNRRLPAGPGFGWKGRFQRLNAVKDAGRVGSRNGNSSGCDRQPVALRFGIRTAQQDPAAPAALFG